MLTTDVCDHTLRRVDNWKKDILCNTNCPQTCRLRRPLYILFLWSHNLRPNIMLKVLQKHSQSRDKIQQTKNHTDTDLCPSYRNKTLHTIIMRRHRHPRTCGSHPVFYSTTHTGHTKCITFDFGSSIKHTHHTKAQCILSIFFILPK